MYRVKLPRAYPDRVRRCAVEDQLPLLQDTYKNSKRTQLLWDDPFAMMKDSATYELRKTLEMQS